MRRHFNAKKLLRGSEGCAKGMLYYYWQCNFHFESSCPPVGWSVGWLVGWLVCRVRWSVIISLKGKEVKLPCSCPIGAFVYS